jgi:CHAD domain-containing protein
VAVEAVLLKLHNQLDRRRRRAARAAEPSALGRIERSVSRAADALSERAVSTPEPRLIASVQVDQARNEAVAALAIGFESGDDAQLHAGRVALKKWRYALETAAVLFDPGVPLQPLRDLQGALGDAHDFAMLHGLLERRANRLRTAGMTTHAEALGPALAKIAGERDRLVEEARRMHEALAPFSQASSEPGPAPPAVTRATKESGGRTT